MFHLLHTRIARPYRSSVALEEERVWIAFYRRVANPAIAAEVVQHLDADADLKRTHSALYLRCKESLRRKKARQARAKRIRSVLRRILGGLLRDPASAMREPAHRAAKSHPKMAELAAAQPDGGPHPDASRPSMARLDGAAVPRNARAA
jgi:hypothetical protein